jgi:hypothetical protein
MPGGVGQHFVVETQYGLVTVILMPNSIAPKSPENLTKHGLSVAVLRAGSRNMGIVMDAKSDLRNTVRLIEQQINWQS